MTGPVAGGAAEFEAKLAAFVTDNRLYGAAAGVVHGDELAWSGGIGLADAADGRLAGPDTLYRIASITKTFTGTAIMQLRDAGKLDLDDPAVDWLPELKASGTPKAIGRVTIRRLLSHQSGLMSEPPGTDWSLDQPRYDGEATRNLARAAQIVAAIPPDQQPKYSNFGYQLLGEIVHRAGGARYPDYLAERILQPLGMSSTAFLPLAGQLAARCAVGYRGRSFSDDLDLAAATPPLWAEGGLWSSVEDVGRWLSFQLSAHSLAVADAGVLAAGTLREMHKPRYLGDETWTWASGITWFAIRKDEVTWVQHSGGLDGFASCACFDRDQRIGAVVLLNGSANATALAMDLGAIGRRLAHSSPPSPRPLSAGPPQYQQLLGLYAGLGMTWLLRLEWRDGKLTFINQDFPDDQITLEPGTDDDTFTAAPGARQSGEMIKFRRLPGGQVGSVFLGSATLLRLDPVAPEHADPG
jgi:CubicO group peptidase (beta-lactamase class C family)